MSEQAGAQTERVETEMSEHDYGHMSVEDEPEGSEAQSGPADEKSKRSSSPSGPTGDLSTHDYGHLTVEDEG